MGPEGLRFFAEGFVPKGITGKSFSAGFMFCLGFFFFSLSQVFKTTWTFPCTSTYLRKWEGRK